MKYLSRILISGVILPINLILPSNDFVLIPEPPTMEENAPIEEILPIESVNTPVEPDESIDTGKFEQILKLSKEFGIDSQLSLDIAKHESRYCTDLHNPNTSATGCYQFLTEDWVDRNGTSRLSTWTAFCKNLYGFNDPENNIENITCFMEMMKNPNNITHWTADLNMRAMLIRRGYVVCGEGKNNCKLIDDQLVRNEAN